LNTIIVITFNIPTG